MSVQRVASRLRDGETSKDRPRTGRPRVVKTETTRKAFETCQEVPANYCIEAEAS